MGGERAVSQEKGLVGSPEGNKHKVGTQDTEGETRKTGAGGKVTGCRRVSG